MPFDIYVKKLIENGNKLNSIVAPYNKADANKLLNGFPNRYNDLNVKVGFGKGVWARVPWIGFFGFGQKPTDGIYPVLLYYRENNVLILAYGISATHKPSLSWSLVKPTRISAYFKSKKIKASGVYNQSFVYRVYEASSVVPSEVVADLDELIKEYKSILSSSASTSSNSGHLSLPISSAPAPVGTKASSFLVSRVVKTILSSGLKYSDQFISRFVISLLTKPFVILSGLSGSGKTQLAIAFAKAMCEDEDKQIRIVPVGSDWTNREPLLGYPNALDPGKYIRPESGVLQLIQRAEKDETHPYFLILDEMNLSYVERYFADFLSALESKASILLWDKDSDGVPKSICLPKNLYIIGTINVDETTYMFSPKVLDRANVIEFKIDPQEMSDFMKSAPSVDLTSIKGALKDVASDFVRISTSMVVSSFDESRDLLIDFFSALKSVNAEFGYRSASEIGRFISLANSLREKHGTLSKVEAVDAVIVQKLLPKLHGSRKKLVPILKTLWTLCKAGVELDQAKAVPAGTLYPLTLDKILRMYRGAVDNGFTSFAEA